VGASIGLDSIVSALRNQGPAESLVALHEVEQMTDDLARRLGNATEYLKDSDKEMIQAAVDAIRSSMYASLDSSHAEEQAEIDASAARIVSCNDAMAAAIAPTGAVGQLLTTATGYQNTYDDLKAEEGVLTTKRDEAVNALTTQMSNTPAAPGAACTHPPGMEFGAWDGYFESNEFVDWFLHESEAYKVKREAQQAAEADLVAKTQEVALAQAQLRTEYCAFSLTLSTTCSTHETCYETELSTFNEAKERIGSAASARAAAYESGEKAIAHLQFLVAEVASPDVGAIDTSHLEINFPTVAAKQSCEVAQPAWDDSVTSPCSHETAPGKGL